MSERRRLREDLEELSRTWGELKAAVLAEVAAHFWGLFAFVLLMIGGVTLVALAWPGALE